MKKIKLRITNLIQNTRSSIMKMEAEVIIGNFVYWGTSSFVQIKVKQPEIPGKRMAFYRFEIVT